MKRVIVEWTRMSMRVVVADGLPAHPRFRVVAVEPATDASAGAVIRRLAAGSSGHVEVMSILPREQIITRLQKFPATRTEELMQMVQLSGKTQLPYPPEQTAITFQVLEQQGGMTTVQVVACHRDVITRHLELLRQAGLEPALLVPGSWALAAWYQRLGRGPDVKEPTLVVNIDADRTDLVVIRDGRPLLSRSLSQGAADWQQPDTGIGALGEEIERTLSSLRKDWVGVEAATLVLTGVGPLQEWRGGLSQRTGVAVVVRPVAGSWQLPDGRGGATGVSYAVALGAASAEGQWLVNLLPHTTRRRQAQRRLLAQMAVSTGLLLGTLGLGAGWLSAYVQRQARIGEQSRVSVRALESVGRELKRQEEEVQRIDALQHERRWMAQMLSELFRAVSGSLSLEQVLIERTRREVIVRGTAPATRDVLDYLGRLEKTKQWERVELRYAESRSRGATARTDFEVLLRARATDLAADAPSGAEGAS